ncbi:MocR-like transcription factor YczR [Thermocatellispora tengchongensis]|uniref:MocR-like transcription factor YczR n=1 Tax=Thermocatellispora tengchongensis TaxID=1073253 RepID=UPI003634EDFD
MDRYLSGPQLAALVRLDPAERPYYRALARAVRTLILDGRLPVRVRMPAERHLADALGVSRTTVTAAYDRLREQGYLDSRQGAGSWTALPDPAALGADTPWLTAGDDGLLPMATAAPAASPLVAEAMARAGEDVPRHTLGIGYEPVGLRELREAVAARYTERGVPTRPEQILVTTGAQHAIHLVMSLLAGPGAPVLVESPTYPHLLDTARRVGARLVPVPVGAERAAPGEDPGDGWSPDLIASALRQSGARLAYLVPDYHNPTGRLMSAATRAAVAEAARRHDAMLVSDESWAELELEPGAPAPPLAAYDAGGRVISIGSAAKLWWGGLRIGWIRTTAALVRRLAALRAAVDIASPLFEQLVVARLFEHVEQARAHRRRTLLAARDTLAAALRAELPGWSFTRPRAGPRCGCAWTPSPRRRWPRPPPRTAYGWRRGRGSAWTARWRATCACRSPSRPRSWPRRCRASPPRRRPWPPARTPRAPCPAR